jgi:hypothetical protein
MNRCTVPRVVKEEIDDCKYLSTSKGLFTDVFQGSQNFLGVIRLSMLRSDSLISYRQGGMTRCHPLLREYHAFYQLSCSTYGSGRDGPVISKLPDPHLVALLDLGKTCSIP